MIEINIKMETIDLEDKIIFFTLPAYLYNDPEKRRSIRRTAQVMKEIYKAKDVLIIPDDTVFKALDVDEAIYKINDIIDALHSIKEKLFEDEEDE